MITVPQLVLLALVLGLINAFDIPTRQAFLVDMVDDRSHFGNAIALNSSMFNAARLIGPSLAGFIVALWGEWACFLLNAVSYAAVLVALLAMRVPKSTPPPSTGIVEGLKEGFRYAFGFGPIRTILALVALVSLASMPLAVLMPASPATCSAAAPARSGCSPRLPVWRLIGAISLAFKKSVLGLGKIMALTTLLGVAMLGVSLSTSLWLSLPLLAATGFAMMVEMASGNTILQTIVEEDKRGR